MAYIVLEIHDERRSTAWAAMSKQDFIAEVAEKRFLSRREVLSAQQVRDYFDDNDTPAEVAAIIKAEGSAVRIIDGPSSAPGWARPSETITEFEHAKCALRRDLRICEIMTEAEAREFVDNIRLPAQQRAAVNAALKGCR